MDYFNSFFVGDFIILLLSIIFGVIWYFILVKKEKISPKKAVELKNKKLKQLYILLIITIFSYVLCFFVEASTLIIIKPLQVFLIFSIPLKLASFAHIRYSMKVNDKKHEN